MRLAHRLQGQKVKSQGHGAVAYCGGQLAAQLVKSPPQKRGLHATEISVCLSVGLSVCRLAVERTQRPRRQGCHKRFLPHEKLHPRDYLRSRRGLTRGVHERATLNCYFTNVYTYGLYRSYDAVVLRSRPIITITEDSPVISLFGLITRTVQTLRILTVLKE